MEAKKQKLSVQTEDLLPVIKKWLYSEKEIFLRELISNSFDAINKLKRIALTENIRDADDTEYAVDIFIDRDRKRLVIEDNGIGMTSDEIVKYIANIAFSGAHDFIKKYEESGNKDKAGIIGNFGLGFYSCFMVATKVEVESLSYREEEKPTLWSCGGGVEYEIGEGSRTKRGTKVTLTLNDDLISEFLDKAKVTDLIRKFVDFLPIPVRVDGSEANRRNALWTKSPNSLKKEDYNEFYKYLYPYQGEPLFYIHLNVDYPFQLQGVLFFPRLRHEMDLNKGNVKIYCKQVFVSDGSQDLIPQYLTVLQGVIDIPNLPLNVSRSYLQNEPQIKKIASHIVKKVADRLKQEYRDNRQEYQKIWPELAPFVKYAMMNDERFYEQAEPALIFQVANSSGEDLKFVTLEEHPKIDNKIYYVSDLKSQAGPLKILNKQEIPVLLLDSLIDNHFIQLLETKGKDYRFTRVDAEVSDQLLDKEESVTKLVASEGKDQKNELIELFKRSLNNDKITIRVEALKDNDIPAMILLPEYMRRYQEMSSIMSKGAKPFEDPVEHTLLLNSKNKVIDALAKPALIINTNQSLDKRSIIACQIYYLARLNQGNMTRADIDELSSACYKLLNQVI